tara:strand:+ start:353 stop:682 length:330 start_codon:yes stop_codon:yes gene_type:complete
MADDQLTQLQERLIESTAEIERLKAKSTTTLSGAEFMTILMVFPVILSFVILGVIIVWKTTSNPTEVAPHLDIVLVAMGLFSGPVTAFIATLAQRLMTESKAKGGQGND